MATLKEIAEKAGVSIGTVDRVLHNRGRVSQDNIDKIMRIVDESGYVPNQLARRLKAHQDICFGVLIPSLESEYGYWSQIELGISEAKYELKTLDVNIIYSFFDRSQPGSYVAAAEELLSHDVLAYITAPLIEEEAREVFLKHPDVPCVFLDSSLPGLKPTWDFSQDPVKAGMTAARLMSFLDPSISRVFTVQSFRSAFNGNMRVKVFSESFLLKNPDAQVTNLLVSDGGKNLKSELLPLIYMEGSHNGIFVVNDGVHQICDMFDELGLSGQFRIIGFDLSPENLSCLEQGKVDVIIGQAPRNQGYEAVMLLYRRYVLLIEDHGSYQAPVDIYIKENASASAYWG